MPNDNTHSCNLIVKKIYSYNEFNNNTRLRRDDLYNPTIHYTSIIVLLLNTQRVVQNMIVIFLNLNKNTVLLRTVPDSASTIWTKYSNILRWQQIVNIHIFIFFFKYPVTDTVNKNKYYYS